MPETWNQTPDGKPVATEHHPDRHLGYPPEKPASEPSVQALEPFIQGCLSLLPEIPGEVGPRMGFLLFVLGAASRFWERFQLDDGRFDAYAEELLTRFGLGLSQAATFLGAIPQLPRYGPARDALVEGEQTLDLWLDSRDTNVMLRVKALIPEWRQIPPK
jgi:hypothetical protein